MTKRLSDFARCTKEQREELIQKMVADGHRSRDAAQLMHDLTTHAGAEAIEAIERIAENAPPEMRSAIMLSALCTTTALLTPFAKEMAQGIANGGSVGVTEARIPMELRI